MARTTAARAEAHLKQLCWLGVGREAVTPALLATLRTIVPNSSSLAFFFDDRQTLAGGYSDNPEAGAIAPLYLGEFHGRRGRELGGAFPDNVHTQMGVQDTEESLGAISVDSGTFGRSDFYNLIYRPQGLHWFMRLMVREGGNGRAVGSVTIYRGPRDRPWTAQEKRRFATLEPFLARALRQESPAAGEPLADGDNLGLLIADGEGRLLHASAEGSRLLTLATHPALTPDTDFRLVGQLPPALVRICRNMMRVVDGAASASAPVHYHRNAWGGFRFEAQWMSGEAGARRIGIVVRHEEPLRLKLVRRIAELGLSRRQAEICLLMANGMSHEAIAGELGISRHTAIAHGRWIYNRLDVHNRSELVARLLRH